VNPSSSIQVAKYLHDAHDVELELSKAGNYLAGKHELVELSSKNPIADAVLKIRDLGKVIQHYENYLKAATFEKLRGPGEDPSKLKEWLQAEGIQSNGDKLSLDSKHSVSQLAHKFNLNGHGYESIPKGYSVSSARTRRFQSSSQFGINFQNQNKRTKVVQLVPKGWLGCWIDSRQIENIVHIWASKDSVRRPAYEANLDWKEYVWLSNKFPHGTYTRKELEEIPSPVNPSWSMYKTYKSTKLALNFFMGPAKFARTTGLEEEKAAKLFAQVHRACPAIRIIGQILSKQMAENEEGFISDPFGHVYGQTDNIQKLVVSLVQGCGTGSAPKAMTVANYKTLHSLDSDKMLYLPCVYIPFTHRFAYGVICGTTH